MNRNHSVQHLIQYFHSEKFLLNILVNKLDFFRLIQIYMFVEDLIDKLFFTDLFTTYVNITLTKFIQNNTIGTE